MEKKIKENMEVYTLTDEDLEKVNGGSAAGDPNFIPVMCPKCLSSIDVPLCEALEKPKLTLYCSKCNGVIECANTHEAPEGSTIQLSVHYIRDL